MMQPNGSYYARMGIWGEPTSGPTGIGTALNTAGDVQRFFGNQYDNIIKKYQSQDAALKNQYTQATMPGQIGAENMRNQTDMQYYPQMQQAKLAQEQQTINEIMARTGLSRAQAAEAGARIGLIGTETQNARAATDPGFMYDALQRQMDASPEGSPRKSYFASILNNLMGQTGGAIPITQGTGRARNAGLMAPGAGGSSTTSPGGGAIPNMPGLAVNPMTVSRSSNKGAEYAKSNDQGDTTVYTSPTTSTVTNLQNRISAQNELSALSPTMNAGIAPYISTWGANVSYPSDLYLAKQGNKNAQQRVDNAEAAMQLVREKAILRLRQASPNAQIGEGSVNDMVRQMYPTMPMHFLRGFNNAKNIAEATNKVDAQLANANQIASQQVASNFPTPVNEAPVWDRTAQAPNMGRFDPVTGKFIPPQTPQAAAIPQGQSPQIQIQQLNAMAQEAIARGADPQMVQRRLQEHMQRMQGGR